MKFSVVIVNYASWPLTVRCLRSFHQTSYEDFEVVVVDNDRSEPPELPFPVRLIRNPENVGFAKACNQVIAASTGDLLLLINPDTVVNADFFERIETLFESDHSVGIVGPKILDPTGSLQLSARKE